MIPYPDLVAALERWRVRNGLPVTGGGVPSLAATPAPSAYAPVSSYAPPVAPPRPTAPMPVAPPPITAKVPDRAQTDEPLDLHDDDVLDEDMLAPEGGDFAMAFGVSTAKPPETSPFSDDDDVPDEKTAIGVPDAGTPFGSMTRGGVPSGSDPHTSPFPTETQPGFDTLDADGEILDESDDLDPRHRS